jgi:glycosyltransferase involved in cell wall biosynthesis
MFAFPDPQCAWLKPALKFAKSMPSSEVPDVVFATGGPWTSLVIGRQLAQFWKLPFVADYRDPWISNPYVTFGSERLNERARQLEKGVCEAAARVITNTYELRERLVKDYPAIEKKSLTITNGFDPDSFSIGAGKSNRPHAANNRLEICHFGTVYGKRTPEVLLGVLLELHRAGQVDGRKLCFRFVGAWEVTGRECEDLAQSLEKVGLLERCPPVSYHACLQQMSQADALLVIQPGSPLQIPGKIYEYVATRRPILLIGGEGATANLVQRHRFGLTTSNHVDHVRRLILDLVEGRQSLSVPGFEEVERFNYQTLTGQLAKVLDEVYQEKARKFD